MSEIPNNVTLIIAAGGLFVLGKIINELISWVAEKIKKDSSATATRENTRAILHLTEKLHKFEISMAGLSAKTDLLTKAFEEIGIAGGRAFAAHNRIDQIDQFLKTQNQSYEPSKKGTPS